jgi:hypothetical protein
MDKQQGHAGSLRGRCLAGLPMVELRAARTAGAGQACRAGRYGLIHRVRRTGGERLLRNAVFGGRCQVLAVCVGAARRGLA